MSYLSARDMLSGPPNWSPLEAHIGDRCADFMWMYSDDGVEFYKHICTRRYLCMNLQGDAFLYIQGKLEPVGFDYAYAVVTSQRL